MKKYALMTLAGLALTLGGINTASAAAGDLAKCYDRVITSCNKTNHPQSCAGSGMDQCDEVYPTPMVLPPSQVLLNNAPANTRR